jgi:dGTPase
MVDKIAYLGRDLEDGIKAGLIRKKDIPEDIAKGLGTDNGKIIGHFVTDTIANSIDQDAITLSDTIFDLMKALKEFNYQRIYLHEDVERKAKKGEAMIEQLFRRLIDILENSERGQNTAYVNSLIKDSPSVSVLFDFVKNISYTESTPAYRIITDYIAGMTDIFAQRTYMQLFLPSPVI